MSTSTDTKKYFLSQGPAIESNTRVQYLSLMQDAGSALWHIATLSTDLDAPHQVAELRSLNTTSLEEDEAVLKMLHTYLKLRPSNKIVAKNNESMGLGYDLAIAFINAWTSDSGLDGYLVATSEGNSARFELPMLKELKNTGFLIGKEIELTITKSQ